MSDADRVAGRGEMSRRDVFRAGVTVASIAAGAAVLGRARDAIAGPPSVGVRTRRIFSVRVNTDAIEDAVRVSIGALRTVVTVVPGAPPTLFYEGLAPTLPIEIDVLADSEPVLANWYGSVKGGRADDVREVVIDILGSNSTAVRTYRFKNVALVGFRPGVSTFENPRLDTYHLAASVAVGTVSIGSA